MATPSHFSNNQQKSIFQIKIELAIRVGNASSTKIRGPQYVYYFEIVCFFRLFSLLISYILLRCVFSFWMVSEKMREKVMGLYVHFLLNINIRVFLKFVSIFLFHFEL